MVQQLRVLLLLQGTRIQFQALTLWLTPTCNSNSKGEDPLLASMGTVHTYGAHIYI